MVFVNQATGQKYQINTHQNGEYSAVGLASGIYTVTLYKNAEDLRAGKELSHVNGFHVLHFENQDLDENTFDFDLKKVQEKAAQGQGLTPKQLRQRQEALERQEKEKATVKALNEKVVAANTAMKAGDPDSAIKVLTEATQIDATHDVIWAEIADAYRGSALKQTDPAEKAKRLQKAVADYRSALISSRKTWRPPPRKIPTMIGAWRRITTTWERLSARRAKSTMP